MSKSYENLNETSEKILGVLIGVIAPIAFGLLIVFISIYLLHDSAYYLFPMSASAYRYVNVEGGLLVDWIIFSAAFLFFYFHKRQKFISYGTIIPFITSLIFLGWISSLA